MADSAIIQVRDPNPGVAAASAASAAAVAAPTAVRTLLPSVSSAFHSSGRVCGDGAVARDVPGRSFSIPARMGLSCSIEIPGISFEDSSAAPASFANSRENSSGVTSLDCSSLAGTSIESAIPGLASEGHSPMELERSLNQSVIEGFTYESMDAASPDGHQHDYREALYRRPEGLVPAAAGGVSDGSVSPSLRQGSCAVNSAASFEASGSVELVSRSSPVDGTQSASASLAKTASPLRPKDVAGVLIRSGQLNVDRKSILAKKKLAAALEKEDEDPLPIPSVAELQEKLAAQKMVFDGQLDELQSLLKVQYSLTGVNPLAQEMGSSVLGSRAVKKPEESLTQEALMSLRDVFAFKDTLTNKDKGELCVLTGGNRTQINEFFAGQQARVKRLILATETAGKIEVSSTAEYTQSQFFPTNTSALTTLSSLEAFEKLLDYMRAERSFTGQTNLLQLILEADFVPGLRFFLEKGGLRLLAKWLSQAANEEQTSLVRLILKALLHLPIVYAIPADISPLVQIMKKLGMYFSSDISSRARALLAKWTKMFSRNGSAKLGQAAETGAIGQSSSSSLHAGPEKKKLKTEAGPVSDAQKEKNLQNKVMQAQPNLKGLDMSERPSSSNLQRSLQTINDPMLASQAAKKKLAEHGKEKRRVVLVEELSTTTRRVRDANARKPTSNPKGARPLSADDIQKAKMRARLLQGSNPSRSQTDPSPQDSTPPDAAAPPVQDSKPPTPQKIEFFKPVQDSAPPPPKPPVAEFFKAVQDLIPPKAPAAEFFKPAPAAAPPIPAPVQEITPAVPLDAPPAVHITELLKRVITWSIPRVFNPDPQWTVAAGDESKEKEIQTLRVRREVEEFYSDPSSIPENPRDPWDVEPDYDDSLTLQVPLEDAPDQGGDSSSQAQEPAAPAHDPALLALLLRNPALVSELTKPADGSIKPIPQQQQQQPVQSGVSSLLQSLQQQQQSHQFPRDTTPPHQFQQQSYGDRYRDRDQQQQFYQHRPGSTSSLAQAPNAGDAGRAPWNAALEMFQGAAAGGGVGYGSGGGGVSGGGGGGGGGIYNSFAPQARDFNANANGGANWNNLAFGQHHRQQQRQQQPPQRQQPHQHHQGMEMRPMTTHNVDGSARFARPPLHHNQHHHHHSQQQNQQPHQSSWFNNNRTAPRSGW